MDVRDAAGIARRRGDGPWSDALGADPAGYVYIERLIHSEREIRCLSRMYLPAGRFGAVLDGRLLRQVNPFNVKLLLRKEFGAHTVATEQIIRFISLDAGEAAALRRNVGETAIQFEATGIDQNGVPITFHEIVIPPSDCLLDLTFTGVPGRARSRAISEPAPRPPRATDSPSPGDR
ncbi:MAG: UTRA domain-containing protein [Hyphomicrobiaceae bacterium]|nr:UTRA domain-containing protein [Hyphomicrobiaceae bacterium]